MGNLTINGNILIMKYTIAIAALLGLMTADQVEAVSRHQRHP